MTRAAGGGRLPYTGPAHRTAHTTTTTSIDMVPKTAATGARQHHPPAIANGGEFTSVPVYQSYTKLGSEFDILKS